MVNEVFISGTGIVFFEWNWVDNDRAKLNQQKNSQNKIRNRRKKNPFKCQNSKILNQHIFKRAYFSLTFNVRLITFYFN